MLPAWGQHGVIPCSTGFVIHTADGEDSDADGDDNGDDNGDATVAQDERHATVADDEVHLGEPERIRRHIGETQLNIPRRQQVLEQQGCEDPWNDPEDDTQPRQCIGERSQLWRVVVYEDPWNDPEEDTQPMDETQ